MAVVVGAARVVGDPVGAPLDAREPGREVDRLAVRLPVAAHGDHFERQRLARAHHVGHLAHAQVEIRAVDRERRARRDGLLVLVGDAGLHDDPARARRFRVEHDLRRERQFAPVRERALAVEREFARTAVEAAVQFVAPEHVVVEAVWPERRVNRLERPDGPGVRERLAHVIAGRERQGDGTRADRDGHGLGQLHQEGVGLVLLHLEAAHVGRGVVAVVVRVVRRGIVRVIQARVFGGLLAVEGDLHPVAAQAGFGQGNRLGQRPGGGEGHVLFPEPAALGVEGAQCRGGAGRHVRQAVPVPLAHPGLEVRLLARLVHAALGEEQHLARGRLGGGGLGVPVVVAVGRAFVLGWKGAGGQVKTVEAQ